MVVDLQEDRIARYTYQLIPMDREVYKPDVELVAKLDAWEEQWCPEVQNVIASAPQGLQGAEGGLGEQGRWLGRAILAKTGGDVVLFHREYFRKGLAAGDVTSDDLYKMVQPRYCKTLAWFQARGDQLLKVLELTVGERGEHIVGARVKIDKTLPAGQRVVESDIDPARVYKVIVQISHIRPVPQHPYGVTDLLKELGVEWHETDQTVLDAAVEYAKAQKTIRPERE